MEQEFYGEVKTTHPYKYEKGRAQSKGRACTVGRTSHDRKIMVQQPANNPEVKSEESTSTLAQGFFTTGYRAVYRGNRSYRYRWGTVTLPSGRNP
jgi:hypothetical protein